MTDKVSSGVSDAGFSVGFQSRRSMGRPRHTVADNLRKSVFASSQSGSTDRHIEEKKETMSAVSALTDIEEFLNHFSKKHPLFD